MNEKILVIIVTYNAIKWIQKCLDSVINSNINGDIYVVDNGSTDGTYEYICTYYNSVILYQSDTNLGFGKANNLGIIYALNNDYDFVYLLNQDAWVFPNTISDMVEISKQYSQYGVLSPIQIEANENKFDVSFNRNSCSYQSCPDLLEDLYFKRLKDIYDVKDVMAAHWLITKECLNRVGGFSTTFSHYGEDTNYVDRVFYHNLKVGIVPRCAAVHDREHRINSSAKEIYLCYIQNLVLLSNIMQVQSHKWLKVILSYMKYTLHYKSILPIKYLFKTLCNYTQIRENMVKSRSTKAFI